MIASIHQSNYLPGLRLLAKIAGSDVFAWLDAVEISRGSWQVRNRIKTPNGPVWLTVPVLGRSSQRIDEAIINDSVPWRRKHLETIRHAYAQAPRFHEIFPRLQILIGDGAIKKLSELNRKLMELFMDGFGIGTQIREVGVPAIEDRNMRLIGMVRELGADEYISSLGSRAYIDERRWEAAGIRHRFQEFTPKPYQQLHGDFIPDLSALDALMMRRGLGETWIRGPGLEETCMRGPGAEAVSTP